MKRITLTFLIFIVAHNVFSNSVYVGHLLHQRWAPKDFSERLKEMELIFFLRPEEEGLKEEYENVFTENWKLSKFKIVGDSKSLLEEVQNNPDEKKCFLSVVGVHVSDSNPASGPYEYYTNWRHYLCLWRPDYDKKGNLDEEGYTYKVAIPLVFDQKEHKKLRVDSKYDAKNPAKWFRYQNWTPSYIGLYLRMMEMSIERDARDIFYSPTSGQKFDHKKAKALWKGELLIPEYTFENRLKNVVEHYDNLGEPEVVDKKMLLSLYKWKYKVLDENEMEEALQEKKENTFYLFFQRGGISVIEVETGDIIVHIIFPLTKTWNYDLSEAKMKKFVKTVERLK